MGAALNTQEDAVCKHCGESYVRTNASQKYCSATHAQRARSQAHYARNKEMMVEKRLKYNEDVPKRIYQRCKSRAKIAGIPFNLDIEDIVVPTHCPVLGIPLKTSSGRQGYFPESPSLDKIRPHLGYVKGNVRVISARANLLKNNATIEELERVLSDLKGVLSETAPT